MWLESAWDFSISVIPFCQQEGVPLSDDSLDDSFNHFPCSLFAHKLSRVWTQQVADTSAIIRGFGTFYIFRFRSVKLYFRAGRYVSPKLEELMVQEWRLCLNLKDSPPAPVSQCILIRKLSFAVYEISQADSRRDFSRCGFWPVVPNFHRLILGERFVCSFLLISE